MQKYIFLVILGVIIVSSSIFTSGAIVWYLAWAWCSLPSFPLVCFHINDVDNHVDIKSADKNDIEETKVTTWVDMFVVCAGSEVHPADYYGWFYYFKMLTVTLIHFPHLWGNSEKIWALAACIEWDFEGQEAFRTAFISKAWFICPTYHVHVPPHTRLGPAWPSGARFRAKWSGAGSLTWKNYPCNYLTTPTN